jgi:IS30 family transposase
MTHCYQLSINEREEISLGLAQGLSKNYIALSLGRSSSTICREVNRNTTKGQAYRAVKAQGRATANRQAYRAVKAQHRANKLTHLARKSRKMDINIPLKHYVLEQLHQLWSPEQIAKRLKILYPENMNMQISHESIYSYLYVLPRGALRKELIKCLRHRHINRRPRSGKSRRNCASIQNYISIEERPAEVADRTIPGHWEGDLLMGHNNGSALGTLVERTTRMTFLVQLKNRGATTVRESFAKEFKHLPKGLKRSLTYDQGQEMAEHKLFTKSTKIQVYFAHPHSPTL